jgi:hypothetical protein
VRRLQGSKAGDGGGLQGVQFDLGLGDIAQHRVDAGPVGVVDQQLGQPGRAVHQVGGNTRGDLATRSASSTAARAAAEA